MKFKLLQVTLDAHNFSINWIDGFNYHCWLIQNIVQINHDNAIIHINIYLQYYKLFHLDIMLQLKQFF